MSDPVYTGAGVHADLAAAEKRIEELEKPVTAMGQPAKMVAITGWELRQVVNAYVDSLRHTSNVSHVVSYTERIAELAKILEKHF